MDEAQARARANAKVRNRLMLIGLMRLAGAALFIVGVMALTGRIDLDRMVAWVVLMIGLAGFALVPFYLARRWRTPKT